MRFVKNLKTIQLTNLTGKFDLYPLQVLTEHYNFTILSFRSSNEIGKRN